MSLSAPSAPLLEVRDLRLAYGGREVLHGLSFDVAEREILAVIGDNGAGKSTLIKAISGAVVPDEGQIWLDGKEVAFKTPIEARAAGIVCRPSKSSRTRRSN